MGKKATPRTKAPDGPKGADGWMGRIYRFAEKFEKTANAAAAPLPSPRIRLWLAGFFHPEETYEKVEKDASLAKIVVNLLIFYFAYSLIFFLFMLALTSSLPADDLLSMGLKKNPDLAQIAIGSLVAGPFVSAFFALAAFAVVFVPARVLGGKGTYVKQSHSMALVLCGSNTLLLALVCIAFAIFLPSFILRDSAFVGTIVSLLTLLANVPVLLLCLAIFLYTAYAYYLVVRKAHGLSAVRSAISIVIAAAIVVLADALVTSIMGG